MAADAHAPAHPTQGPADLAHGTHGAHDSLVQHQFDDMEQQRESFSLGMWLFLATEVMMFGGLFFAYSLYRGMHPAAFEIASSHLNVTVGTINTFVLLISSLTMALAVHAAAIKDTKRLVLFLTLTWILGAAFLGVKAYEWYVDYVEGLIPGVNWTYHTSHHFAEEVRGLAQRNIGPQHVQMYFVIYFCMTGLHAIHMSVGLAILGIFIAMAAKGKFTSGNDQPVEIFGLYWHLVDIVWVFLFPLLYLIAQYSPFGKAGGGH